MDTLPAMTRKRLTGDIKLIKKDPHDFFDAVPQEENILKWQFVLKGPPDSDYEYLDENNKKVPGYYFGELLFPTEYPMKPPDVIMKTPNGRFEPERKICLSNTGFHQDTWSPMWNINAMLNGFLSIMLDDKEHGIAHIHISKKERQKLAADSIAYNKKYFKASLNNFSRFLDENGDPIVCEVKVAKVEKVIKVDVKEVDKVVDVIKEVKEVDKVVEKVIEEEEEKNKIKVKKAKVVKVVKPKKNKKVKQVEEEVEEEEVDDGFGEYNPDDFK